MYQVWTRAQYEEAWRLTDCRDLPEVEQIIRETFGQDIEVKVSTPVEYDARIAVRIQTPKDQPKAALEAPVTPQDKKEVARSEAKKS